MIEMKEIEGKLFVNIYLHKIDEIYTVSKDYYTVKDGNVILVNDSFEEITGDSISCLLTNCKQIGVYDSKKIYKRIVCEYPYQELNKLLFKSKFKK